MGCSSSKQIEEPSSSDRRPNRPKAPPKLKREDAFNHDLSMDRDYDYSQPVPKFSRPNVGDRRRTPGGAPSSVRTRSRSDERPTPTWDRALNGIAGRGDERRLDSDAIRRSAQESLKDPEFMTRNLSSFANLSSAKADNNVFEERRRADARRREEGQKMKRGLMMM